MVCRCVYYPASPVGWHHPLYSLEFAAVERGPAAVDEGQLWRAGLHPLPELAQRQRGGLLDRAPQRAGGSQGHLHLVGRQLAGHIAAQLGRGAHQRPAHEIWKYRHPAPGLAGQIEQVVAAAFDGLQRREQRAARAWLGALGENVVQPVANDGLAGAMEVGHDRHELALGLVEPFALDHHQVFVQVQRAQPAGAGQEALGALIHLVHALFELSLNVSRVERVEHLRH